MIQIQLKSVGFSIKVAPKLILRFFGGTQFEDFGVASHNFRFIRFFKETLLNGKISSNIVLDVQTIKVL